MSIDLVPGMFLGELELLEQVGAGGFSVVWKARRAGSDELLAVKVPLVERFVEHLRQEAALAGRFDDPQVVPIVEVHLDAEPPHLVMPWVDGAPLELPSEVPAPEALLPALELGRDLARVLGRLHAAGIAHGDVKPSNLLIADGRVKLLDLGLGRLAVETNLERSLAQSLVSVDGRSIAGTLDYMAPELFEGKAPGPASDVYALGVLLHHLTTGRPPAFGVGPEEQNPWLTPGLEPLLARMLEQDPARRLRLGPDLDQALARLCAAERRCLARRNGHARRRVLRRRLRVLKSGLRALLIGAALPVLAVGLWQLSSAARTNLDIDPGLVGVLGTFVGFPVGLLVMLLGMTTINAWILGVPEGLYKERPGHPIWSFMMQ